MEYDPLRPSDQKADPLYHAGRMREYANETVLIRSPFFRIIGKDRSDGDTDGKSADGFQREHNGLPFLHQRVTVQSENVEGECKRNEDHDGQSGEKDPHRGLSETDIYFFFHRFLLSFGYIFIIQDAVLFVIHKFLGIMEKKFHKCDLQS